MEVKKILNRHHDVQRIERISLTLRISSGEREWYFNQKLCYSLWNTVIHCTAGFFLNVLNIDAHFETSPIYFLQTCKNWYRIAQDDFLWRNLVICNWKMPQNIRLPTEAVSWKAEFKRLYYHAPLIESEVLTDHTDQVLHISYSHNGQLFATSSKDCFVKVLWNII